MGFDPDVVYSMGKTPIGRGDRVVWYTDGLLEVTNAAGEFFGSDGLRAFVEANGTLRPDDFADALLAHLRTWSGRTGGHWSSTMT